jgi:hypothetical protein
VTLCPKLEPNIETISYELPEYIDLEESFPSDLQRIIIIGLTDNVNLNIEEHKILSTVSLLLVILRLAVISLPLKA